MPVSSLPADQVAVLELVLERGRSYDEIADLLGIDAHAVRARAHAAIDALGPQNGSGRRITTARRAELADYLLGQQDEEAAEQTRNHLASSSGSRAWVRVVAGELKPLAGEKGLPEIPAEGKGTDAPTRVAKAPKPKKRPASAAAAKDADDEADEDADADDDDDGGGAGTGLGRAGGLPAPSSRLGGALLIAGVLVVVIVAIVLLTRGGDDDDGGSTVSKTTPAQTTPAAAPQVIGQINLTGEGRAVGIAQIVKQGNTQALVIAGQNLPADKDTAYAVWLYNSGKDAKRLGYAQPSQTAGRLEAIAPLPADSSKYKDLVISAESREEATKEGGGPTTPSKIVLRGALASATPPPAGGAGGAGGATPTTPGAATPGATTPGTTAP
jgi:Sigma-70, region 4